MKQLESINLRAPKEQKEPLLDYKDLLLWMCTVCASLITYLLFDKGLMILFGEIVRDAIAVVIIIGLITAFLFQISKWIIAIAQIKKPKTTRSRT